MDSLKRFYQVVPRPEKEDASCNHQLLSTDKETGQPLMSRKLHSKISKQQQETKAQKNTNLPWPQHQKVSQTLELPPTGKMKHLMKNQMTWTLEMAMETGETISMISVTTLVTPPPPRNPLTKWLDCKTFPTMQPFKCQTQPDHQPVVGCSTAHTQPIILLPELSPLHSNCSTDKLLRVTFLYSRHPWLGAMLALPLVCPGLQAAAA
mmetsp:Transcript_777/g.1101  ORF Transcript_777/g.1101 Transcript_777/m.1101 type:complete len:207 (+) Transcript_777:1379-1999(+)